MVTSRRLSTVFALSLSATPPALDRDRNQPMPCAFTPSHAIGNQALNEAGCARRAASMVSASYQSQALTSLGSGVGVPSQSPTKTWSNSCSAKPSASSTEYVNSNALVKAQSIPISSLKRRRAAASGVSPGRG